MGLLYVFPVSTDETDFVVLNDESITLKTYGLPYIFWLYAFCSIAVVAFMFAAVRAPVLKLVSLGDGTDAILGYSLLGFIALIPLVILSFFFYEKRIIKTPHTMTLEYRLFGLKVFSETFKTNSFYIESYLTSPNVARMKGTEESLGFQNKGYFMLWMEIKEGKKILVDRHSRRADLDKLNTLLSLRS